MDEVPGTPAREPEQKLRSTQGPGARPPTGGNRRTPAARGSGVSAATTIGKPGAEIGMDQRRGLSLAMKFSLGIALLIAFIAIFYAALVSHLFESKLHEELVHYGYGLAISQRTLAERMWNSCREWKKTRAPSEESYRESTEGKKDAQQLQAIVLRDRRMLALTLWAAHDAPARDSNARIVWSGDAPASYAVPEQTRTVDLPEADPGVEFGWGQYNQERALYFRVPLEGPSEEPVAMLQVVLSETSIQAEVRSVRVTIALVGLAVMALGIVLALLLASVVTRPIHALVMDMDAVARGDLDHQPRVRSRDEIGLLARALARMMRGLREAREQERQVQLLSTDLNQAQEVAARLMPEKKPNLPGYDIHTVYRCAREIGGDYYDFIPVDPEHLAFVVADVSGKGISAAMVVGTTRTVLRMLAPMNHSPADVLAKTNYHVFRDVKRGMFVTALYAILNVRTRELRVASAGHNPLVLWRAASKVHQLVRPNGIALGFDKGPLFDRTIREQTLKLNRGDRIVLYTDGVVEAMNEEREQWGDEAFYQFVDEFAELNSVEFARLLLDAVDEHTGRAEQHDDITLTTFRVE